MKIFSVFNTRPAYRRRALIASILPGCMALPAHAQEATSLPEITVSGGATGTAAAQSTAGGPPGEPIVAASGSLTVPGTAEAIQNIQLTPGGVEVVPDTRWRDTPGNTLKDVLDYTPGVIAQPKWGEDTRLSIRGSGLSRNFHLRGIQLYQDGVPVNFSDGSGDFQEIDPTAFRYTEVYKGANGLFLGANSLGGAINFASPTGHDADAFQTRFDAGGFGFSRVQASSGGVHGNMDGFVTGSFLHQDGFRNQSSGELSRLSGNVGWRLSDGMETRFFFNAADIEQEIPGTVTKRSALETPKLANSGNVLRNYQRNIESFRITNKTGWERDGTRIEFGGYAVDKSLIHPIFQFLDYNYHDFGGFARLTREGTVAGRKNRFTAGATITSGWVGNSQYANLPGGLKGALLSQSKDSAENTILYIENGFDLVPGFTLVTGLNHVDATREREDRFPAFPDTSGESGYSFANPKAGLLWQVDPDWQIFGNISRSGEAPTFAELNFTNVIQSDTKAQRATTYEIGTRGTRENFTWDVALYHADIENEFQFFDLGGGNFLVTNANSTVHRGLELGFGFALWQNLMHRDAGDKLWLDTVYTLNDFYFDNDPVWGNNELPGAPRHYLRAELLYRHPGGFYAGPNIEWVPQAYFVDNANSQDTDAYALLGFRMGKSIGENASIYVDARNLTDQRYIASTSVAAIANINSALYEPGTGRAIYGGLRVAW